MILIGKARHRIVRLRLQRCARDAALGRRAQDRQARAPDQVIDESGDEHGLARARQAGDAEPQGAAAEIFRKAARRDAGFEDEVVEN